MTSSGYVPKRRGVLEHLQDGRLTLQELGAHDVLLLLADKSTGIWTGSAKALAANCGAGDVSDRQGRHILESLESGGYIKRFPIRRSHHNYPILLNRFQVTFGACSGMRLNASATSDWRKPVYERCQEQGAEHGVEQGAEHGAEHGAESAPIREVRPETRERKTKAAAQPAAIALAVPSWLPVETWQAYVEMRRSIRKPMTPHATKLVIRKLDELRARGHAPQQVLEQSILNSWQGVFELKEGGRNGNIHSGHADRQSRTLEAARRASA